MLIRSDRLLLLLPLALLPVTNVVVRYRLSYFPRRQETQETTEDKPPTLVGVTKRVYGEEGFKGFYRGLLPVIILVVFGLPHLSLAASRPWMGLLYKPIITPAPFIWDIQGDFLLFPALVKNVFVMLALTWIYRCISTPAKLSFTGHTLSDAAQSLLSPFELSPILLMPFKLVLNPGLAYTTFLSFFLRLIYPLLFQPPSWNDWNDPYRQGAFFKVTLPYFLIMLLILPPIDLVTTRLLAQKSQGYLPFWNIGLKAKVYTIIIGLVNALALPIVLDDSPKNYIGGAVEFLLCIIDAISGLFLSIAWTQRWRRLSREREAQAALSEESPLLAGDLVHAEENEDTAIQ